MKRLIFLIWLMATGMAWGDITKVIEDVASPITFTHSSGCDSVILYIGNDSTSWDTDSTQMTAVFNADNTTWLENVTVTAAGIYTIKFNYYETGDVTTYTLLGLVECDSSTNKDLIAEVNGLNGWAPMDGTDSLKLARVGISASTTAPAFSVQNNAGGHGISVDVSGGTGGAGMNLATSSSAGAALLLSGNPRDLVGTIHSTNFEAGAIDANAIGGTGADEIADSVNVPGAIVSAFNDSVLIDTSWVGQDPEAWTAADSAAYQGEAGLLDSTTVALAVGEALADSNLPVDIAAIKGYVDTEIAILVARQDSLRLALGWPNASPTWDSLANNTTDQIAALILTLDSLTAKVGPFGDSSVSSTPFTVFYWLQVQIKAYVDSAYASLGWDTTDLHTKVDNLSAGTGPRLCSLFVATGAGAAMTDGETRMTSGATSYTANIDGNGYAVYSLTDATWSGLAYSTGYKQDTIPQTFVITASVKDTITMTAVTVAGATDPQKVKVYAWTDRILGDTLEGAIMTIIPRVRGRGNWIAANDRIVLPRQEWAVADDSGFVSLDVYPTETTNNQDGDSLYFDIQISKQGYPTAIFEKFRVYDDSTGASQQVQRQ